MEHLGKAGRQEGDARDAPPSACAALLLTHDPLLSSPSTTPRSGNDGGSTVDQGSCMFGHLDPNAGTGTDIGALSDSGELAALCLSD